VSVFSGTGHTEELYAKLRLWVNTDKGYTIPKFQAWRVSNINGEVLTKEELYDMKEYGEDLWGPAKCTRYEYALDGTIKRRIAITWGSDFQINVPMSEDELKLTLPTGTEVFDEALGDLYTVP